MMKIKNNSLIKLISAGQKNSSLNKQNNRKLQRDKRHNRYACHSYSCPCMMPEYID